MNAPQRLELWARVIAEFQDSLYQLVGLILNDNAPYIEDLISEFQLWLGIDGDGNPVEPNYTPYTISVKTLMGQPTARVTLKDTGDFYVSITIRIMGDGFYFEATDDKAAKLVKKYGKEILKLTPENLSSVIWDYIYADLMSMLQFKLFDKDETI